MKKFIAILMTLLLMCSMTVALAAEEVIAIDIQAVDYQTGKAVSKSYVENELFKLRVDLNVPRFADIENLDLIIECDGVEVEQPIIELVTGRYYIEGIVMEQPAAICVKVKDVAMENAETAEDMYIAMKTDRSVSKCYYFNAVQPTYNQPMAIPKTGGNTMDIIIPSVILAATAALILRGTVRKAKR